MVAHLASTPLTIRRWTPASAAGALTEIVNQCYWLLAVYLLAHCLGSSLEILSNAALSSTSTLHRK